MVRLPIQTHLFMLIVRFLVVVAGGLSLFDIRGSGSTALLSVHAMTSNCVGSIDWARDDQCYFPSFTIRYDTALTTYYTTGERIIYRVNITIWQNKESFIVLLQLNANTRILTHDDGLEFPLRRNSNGSFHRGSCWILSGMYPFGILCWPKSERCIYSHVRVIRKGRWTLAIWIGVLISASVPNINCTSILYEQNLIFYQNVGK